jgi:hypothetical protein
VIQHPLNLHCARPCPPAAPRLRFSAKLDELLATGPDFGGDTSEPLHSGFATGLFLGYHGGDNRHLKTKLAAAYLQ